MSNFVRFINKVLGEIFNIKLSRAERQIRQCMYDGLRYLRDSIGFQRNFCIHLGVAEGAEIEALKHAKVSLKQIDVVILEATFTSKLVGAHDFILSREEMKQLNFVIFDWFDIRVRPNGGIISGRSCICLN